MKYHTASQLRKLFVDYFVMNSHTAVRSASLIPSGDKTLLFTNAGMVPFKDVFLGFEKRNYQRAVSVQRCIRAGGKHNDLENVGYTARHHTFFEMLGNFSFGDYFKLKAIELAWCFITEELGIPKEKLWITVHHTDDEAFEIWEKHIEIPKERIVPSGDKDNFWSMGSVGPCGPCSEIFYDYGAEVTGGLPGSAEADGDRYVEIWNLVFMQFNRNEKGELIPLPKPSVDTGMGLERLAAVVQGVQNNYDTNELATLVQKAKSLVSGEPNEKYSASFKVLADHIRSCAFLIADGIVPSNENQGYVLRRIIRRAIRHGHKIGASQGPFFHQLLEPLCACMGEDYPELIENQVKITGVLKKEEQRFSETLVRGMQVLKQKLQEPANQREISGELAFHLYDTFGFPVDLTADIAREQNLSVDLEVFESCMKLQQQKARETTNFANQMMNVDVPAVDNFTGYEQIYVKATDIVSLFNEEGEVIKQVTIGGGKAYVYLRQCPFYAESGGQISDLGQLLLEDNSVFLVQGVHKQGLTHILYGEATQGEFNVGDTIVAQVDENRYQIQRNHTATHILHWALREVLGKHVQQRGSLVGIDKLRFDFSYDEAINERQLRAIETLINDKILSNDVIKISSMPIDEAKKLGAMALFGEKYRDIVRVVKVGDYSIELCGGTHTQQTGNIGSCLLVSESAIATGIRRIEAKVGDAALRWSNQQKKVLQQASSLLKIPADKVAERLQNVLQKQCELNQTISRLQDELQANRSKNLNVERFSEVNILREHLGDIDNKKMRQYMDQYKQKIGSGIIFLSMSVNGKGQIICGVTKDLLGKYHAGKLVNAVAQFADSKGGGREDMAMAGASVEKLESAFKAIPEILA